MAQLLRSIGSSFLILFLISYLSLSNLALAQSALQQCATRVANEYYWFYDDTKLKYSITGNQMDWCPLWAAVCSYVYRNCGSVVRCEFTNHDSGITTHYDPSSPTSYTSFMRCTSCNVEVSVDARLLLAYDIVVPKSTYTYQAPPTITTIDDILQPGESPNDMLAESSSASSATGAVTAVFVVGSIIGSVIAVKTSSAHAGFLGVGAGGATATVANTQTGGGSGESVIDAVTLLLHFQFISTSGLLSISYPALYRFFSYNFAWANLILGSDAFKVAVRNMVADPSCLSKLGSLDPTRDTDQHSVTGMTVMGVRYNLDRATIGGLVYLTVIMGVAVALAVFVLAAVFLRTLNAIFKSEKLQAQVDMWPSRASSMSLRLFIWVLGSVATFAIYQFAESCSSGSLIAFAAVEFVLIILTLLIVSILIIKTAHAQGPEALFMSSESEESNYSRKWGSLYRLLKPALYWFFIPDYIWVLARSIIVGAGQRSGISQICALVGLETVILLALLIKRPYNTSSRNAFYIFSTCKRLFASAALLVFWGGFGVPIDIKRIIGIILIIVESAYAVALFVVLLLHAGAKIMKWNTERKERRRTSVANESLTTERPGMPQMHYIRASDISPIQEKSY